MAEFFFFQNCQSLHILAGRPVLPVDPAEDPGVGGVSRAVGDPVGPVLGQPVLLGHRPQAGPHHRHLHQDVRLLRADVVSPQCGQRLVDTAIAWNFKLFYSQG